MPNKTVIQTEAAPKAIGPYSQAIRAGSFVFCSGQIPLDPATGNLVEGGVVEQTHRVLQSVRGLLQASGLDLKDVVKTTVFLKNMADFAAMNGVYATYFTENPPARSTVEVARLPRDVAVEIECIAVAG